VANNIFAPQPALYNALAPQTGGIFDPLNQMVVGRQAMAAQDLAAQQQAAAQEQALQDQADAIFAYAKSQDVPVTSEQALNYAKAKVKPTDIKADTLNVQRVIDTPEGPKLMNFNIPRQPGREIISTELGKAPPKGGGIKVNADGSVEIGYSPLTSKTTIGEVEKQQLQTNNAQAALDSVRKRADALPDPMWTVQGRGVSSAKDLLAKLGKPRSADEAKARRQYMQFIQSTGKYFDSYRKAITGAAAAKSELDQLMKRVPVAEGNVNFDSKVDFYAKMDFLQQFQDATARRLADLKANGIEIVPSKEGNLIGRDQGGNKVDVSAEFPIDNYMNWDTQAAQPSQGQPVQISSDAEYDNLPSGAVFIGPDGVQRRKP